MIIRIEITGISCKISGKVIESRDIKKHKGDIIGTVYYNLETPEGYYQVHGSKNFAPEIKGNFGTLFSDFPKKGDILNIEVNRYTHKVTGILRDKEMYKNTYLPLCRTEQYPPKLPKPYTLEQRIFFTGVFIVILLIFYICIRGALKKYFFRK